LLAMETECLPRQAGKQLQVCFAAVAMIGNGPAATLSQHGLTAVSQLPLTVEQARCSQNPKCRRAHGIGEVPSAGSCQTKRFLGTGCRSSVAAFTTASGAVALCGVAMHQLDSRGLRRSPRGAPLAVSLRSKRYQQIMRRAASVADKDPGSMTRKEVGGQQELNAMIADLSKPREKEELDPQNLNSFTAVQLKEHLKTAGLAVSGKKEELVARLEEHLSGKKEAANEDDDRSSPSSSHEEELDFSNLERSGQIAILGVPNSGKSSLVNELVGSKVTIVSPKPQTTRQRTLGVALLSPKPESTKPTTQACFVDTAGIMQYDRSKEREDNFRIHLRNKRESTHLHKAMVKTAWKSVREADVLFWVLDASKCFVYGDYMPESATLDGVEIIPRLALAWWLHPELREELEFIERLRKLQRKVHVVLNKIDLLEDMAVDVEEYTIMMRARLKEDLGIDQDGEELLQNLWAVSVLNQPETLVPIKRWLCENLPKQSPIYPVEMTTDAPRRVLASEITREKLFLNLRKEVPYKIAVRNVMWEPQEDGSLHLGQVVVAENKRHVNILRSALKEVTEDAETDISEHVNCGRPVLLHFRLEVDPEWVEKQEYYSDVQGLCGESLVYNI